MVRWSNLPLQLVEVIDSKITTYLDKVRIRLVCKSWRSRLPRLRQHAWLLHKPYGNAEGMHGLYNPIDDKFYEIDLKYAKEKYIKGCSYGWVAILNDDIPEIKNPARQKVYLLNMFTNAHVSLPSTEIRPHIRKIVLSSPFADKKCIAVAIYKYAGEITYCKCGDKTWNHIYISHADVRDVIFHEDKLIVLRLDGIILVYELTEPPAKPNFVKYIPKPDYNYERSWAARACFVKSSAGGLILVRIIEEKNKRPVFELYKIDVINGKMHQIYDIGDDNLFLDSTSAIMGPSTTTGAERCQVYVIKNITLPDSDIEKSSLIVLNLEKGSLRILSDSKTSSEVLCRPNIWVKMN